MLTKNKHWSYFRTPRANDLTSITQSGTCSCCNKLFPFSDFYLEYYCKGCSIFCCDSCLFGTVIKERHKRKLPRLSSLPPLRTPGYDPKYNVKLCKKCHIIVDDKSSYVKHYHDVIIHTH
jgi:hypothetical protein